MCHLLSGGLLAAAGRKGSHKYVIIYGRAERSMDLMMWGQEEVGTGTVLSNENAAAFSAMGRLL